MDPAAAPRTWRRAVIDWLPVAAIAVAYAVLHALADTLAPGAHVQPQLGFDRWIGFGVPPTVRLQRELWHPGDPQWYDYAAWLVYLSHFVVTLTVAIVLWVRAYVQFLRFRIIFLVVTFAGFATYVVYPAIPPWLASERHDMAHTTRIVRDVWASIGLTSVASVFGAKSKYAFPVGALPSLHAAWPLILTLFLWPIAGRWRILLVAYTLAMACTLVYTADHFVFDILLGWGYATLGYVIVRRVVPDPASSHASIRRPWR